MPETTTLLDRFFSARPGILLLWLLVLICIASSNGLFSPPVLDDNRSFLEAGKMHPQEFSVAAIKQIATTRFGIARFVPLLTFAVNNKLSLGNFAYYHLTNITIHLLAVTTLYFFLQGLFSRTILQGRRTFLPPALIILGVCGLWGLSPVQTNVVTYLVQRMTSLMTLFYLLSMTLYLYGRTAKPGTARLTLLTLSAVSAALAFISKENSATLPLALLLLETTLITPGSLPRLLARLRPRHWLFIGLILLLVLPVPLKYLMQVINSYGSRPFTCWERLLTESRVVVWYLSLLLLPLPGRMNLDHDPLISQSLFAPPSTVLSIILLGVIVVTTWRYRHKSPMITFGVFFFFLNLLIESTVVPLELVFEHRLYLPSVGFFMAGAGIIDLLLTRHQAKLEKYRDPKLYWLGLVVLLASSSLLTTLRNNDWQDKLSLYRDILVKSPEKPRAYTNYGMALGQMGRYEEAIPLLEKAISLGTRYNEVYVTSANNLINCLKHTAGPNQALTRAERLLKDIPDHANQIDLPSFLFNLGNLYWQTGNYPAALKSFQDALRREDPANNGYLLMSISALINDVYKNTGGGDAIGMARFSEDSTAVTYALAETLLDIRNYEETERLLARGLTRPTAPEQAAFEKLRTRLTDEQARNRQVAEALDVSRDEFLNRDRKNILILRFAQEITDHYPPLYFLAEQMLMHLKALSPRDPFVEWAIIKLHSARKSPNVDLDSLRQTIAANPNFAPLLEIEIRHLLGLHRQDEALAAMTTLLQTYPGSPNRTYWLVNMQDLRNDSKSDE